MPGQWTAKRKRAAVRNPDGTFKEWRGGQRKQDMKKQKNNFHGIQTHIGKEFKRQHGRTAKVGDIVRTKKADGTHHKGAMWYIRTPHGWRKSGQYAKPSKAKIKEIIKKSRGLAKHFSRFQSKLY